MKLVDGDEKPPVNQADYEHNNENDFFISEDIKTIVFCFNQLNVQGKAEFAAKHSNALQRLTDQSTSPEEKHRIINSFVDHITYFKELQAVDIVYRT